MSKTNRDEFYLHGHIYSEDFRYHLPLFNSSSILYLENHMICPQCTIFIHFMRWFVRHNYIFITELVVVILDVLIGMAQVMRIHLNHSFIFTVGENLMWKNIIINYISVFTLHYTSLRPDIVIWSCVTKQIVIAELTVPWEDRAEVANERKRTSTMS